MGKDIVVIENDSTVIAHLKHKDMLVTLGVPASKPSVNPVENSLGNMGPYMAWGTSNNFPGDIVSKIYKNSIIPSAIQWMTNQLSAGGVVPCVMDGYDAMNNEIYKPVITPAIQEFIDNNNLLYYLPEAIKDMLTWNHVYVELGFNPYRNTIGSIAVQDAMWCRLGLQDKKGAIKSVFIDANWSAGIANENTWTELPMIDPYHNSVGMAKAATGRSMIYPVMMKSHGKVYYQDAAWQSIVLSGWLDVAEGIPLFKKYLLGNQMTIKYLVHVPESWWLWKYPKWTSATSEQRAIWRTESLTEFNDAVSGVTKTGNTLFLTFRDGANGGSFTKWEVVEMLGSKALDGALIEDSQEASSHIFSALALDVALYGHIPGKSMGAGSGSDKRVANNIFIINNSIIQDYALDPLNFVSKYNDYKVDGKRVVWKTKSWLVATMNTGKEMLGGTNTKNAKTTQD